MIQTSFAKVTILLSICSVNVIHAMTSLPSRRRLGCCGDTGVDCKLNCLLFKCEKKACWARTKLDRKTQKFLEKINKKTELSDVKTLNKWKWERRVAAARDPECPAAVITNEINRQIEWIKNPQAFERKYFANRCFGNCGNPSPRAGNPRRCQCGEIYLGQPCPCNPEGYTSRTFVQWRTDTDFTPYPWASCELGCEQGFVRSAEHAKALRESRQKKTQKHKNKTKLTPKQEKLKAKHEELRAWATRIGFKPHKIERENLTRYAKRYKIDVPSGLCENCSAPEYCNECPGSELNILISLQRYFTPKTPMLIQLVNGTKKWISSFWAEKEGRRLAALPEKTRQEISLRHFARQRKDRSQQSTLAAR